MSQNRHSTKLSNFSCLDAEPLEVHRDELVAGHDWLCVLHPGGGVQRAAVGLAGAVRGLRPEEGESKKNQYH